MALSTLHKIELNSLKFRGFRFRAKEDKKCLNCLFSIVLNSSLPLVFCTVQKTFLAQKKKKKKKKTKKKKKIKRNTKWKNEACPMNNWNSSVLKNSASAVVCFTVHFLFLSFFFFFFFFTFVYFPRLWLVDFLFNIPMNKTNIVGANFYDNGNTRVKLTMP